MAESEDFYGALDESDADDVEFYGEEDDDDDSEFFGAKKKKRAKKAKRGPNGLPRGWAYETLQVPNTVVGAGGVANINVLPTRDCFVRDLELFAAVAATGVYAPGITVNSIMHAGNNLLNGNGPVWMDIFLAVSQKTHHRLEYRKKVKNNEPIVIQCGNVTAAAITVGGQFVTISRH